MHKNALRKRKFQKSWTTNGLGQENWPWGASRSGTPSSWMFLSKIENLCGNHIFWTFFIICQNFFLSFLGLCFVKIVNFMKILAKLGYLCNNLKIQTKNVKNSISYDILNNFCWYLWIIWPISNFGQKPHKIDNFY